MSHYSRISLYGESFRPTHLYKNKKCFMLVQMSGKMLYLTLSIYKNTTRKLIYIFPSCLSLHLTNV
ncbi:hypothetical protein CO726_30970 [Bacillus fungorum]|uniref:Uncharacterized protein n=1 Tax=Bacillus fungorum TaxID=2039284 RepID=A0A2G6Q4C6_9BACI|nr:hypothetical protein CO726_30970 [Bacillus fungorum]